MTTPTAAARHVDPVTGLIPWGSKLTPEQREWQITKLLPAILATLDDIADDAKDAGQPVR